MARTKGSNKKTKETIRCPMCGRTQAISNYYMTSSPLYAKNYGRLVFCKECVWKTFDTYYNILGDMKRAIIITCMKFDVPFSIGDYEGTQKQLSGDPTAHPIKVYMTKINSLGSFNNDLAGFDPNLILDDDSEKEILLESDTSQSQIISDFNLTEDIVKYWGRGKSIWEYEFLENEMFMLKTDFECSDYSMEMIMKDICFINLEIEKLRLQNNNAGVAKLIKTRSELMNDGNLKPVQSTGADKNEKVSFGTLIKKWENERPISKAMDDEMKKYIDTYLIGHLAKMEGLNNDLVKQYEEAIREYTLDMETIKNVEDDD